MRISPVFSNILKASSIYKNNQNDYSSCNVVTRTFTQVNKDEFIKSQPSFTAIKSASEFRNLVSFRRIHCIYCGRPLLSDKVVNRLKSSGIFSGPIKNFAQEMFNYIEYLHPTEKEFVKKIAIMAFDTPNIRLSEAIKKLYPQANKELLLEQKPIFKELATLTEEMPHGYKTKYKELLKISKYRLDEKEYIPSEFSGKEFRYKISRISDTIKDDYMAKKIEKIAEPLSHPIFKKEKEPLTQKFIDNILKLTETRDVNKKNLQKEDLQLIIVNKIRQYGEILNRKDILYLCKIAQNTIEKRPVKLKFSNKAFKYDLNEALDGMPNQELRNKIDAIVAKLPNSRTSVNAFITKHELSASDAIGYNVLRPSIVTIEHIHPKSLGGPNELGNYALACSMDNNVRSNVDLREFIKNFDIKNQKQYFKEIFEEANKGKIQFKTAIKMLDTFFNESGRNIDINKNGIKK